MKLRMLLPSCSVGILLSLTGFAASVDDLRLIDAVQNGDGAAVRNFIEHHADVNAVRPDGSTALMWAIHRSDSQTVDLLIRSGAKVNVADDYGLTPLAIACTGRNASIIDRLLRGGANPNSTQWTGETPLITCAHTGTLEGVKSLLAHGANPNAKEDVQGHTALMRAVAEKHTDVARAVIEGGADVRAKSKKGFTPLLFAAQQGDIDTAKILLAAGADVNEAHPDYGSPLVMATASNREAFALFLLENEANPNAADAYGVSALHYAIPQGIAGVDSVSIVYRPYDEIPPDMPKLVKALLARGAHPNVQVTKDFAPYSRSPYARQTSFVGVTPFMFAAAAADLEVMHILMDAGADPRFKSKDGSTSLMFAAGVGRTDDRQTKELYDNALEAVKLLAGLGIDVNDANARGRTAMHGASSIGADEIIQFLADKGANPDTKDSRGTSPLKVASGLVKVSDGADRVYQHTVALLLKLGAKPLTQAQQTPVEEDQ